MTKNFQGDNLEEKCAKERERVCEYERERERRGDENGKGGEESMNKRQLAQDIKLFFSLLQFFSDGEKVGSSVEKDFFCCFCCPLMTDTFTAAYYQTSDSLGGRKKLFSLSLSLSHALSISLSQTHTLSFF